MRLVMLVRKPPVTSTSSNILLHHTGGLCIHGTRIPTEDNLNGGAYGGNYKKRDHYSSTDANADATLSRLRSGIGIFQQPEGRWPANVIFQHNVRCDVDKTECVCQSFDGIPETRSGKSKQIHPAYPGKSLFMNGYSTPFNQHGDSGSVLRFFKQIKE